MFVVFLTVVSWGAVVFIFETLVLYSKIWPAPKVRVFIDQLVEHCSANSEAMGSNPVKVPKLFRVNKQLLKLQLPKLIEIHILIYFRTSHHLYSK